MRQLNLNLCAIAAIAAAILAQPMHAKAADDIVDTAVKAGSFKTLAAALQAADLVDALKAKGPFTVFAPSDEAFAKLPKGTVETLLKPENKSKLAGILAYHVVSGSIPAEEVVKLSGATTLNGQRADIKLSSGKVMVDQANVVTTDIQCSNGIIHVIDQVILPAEDTIPATAEKADQFTTLLAAVKAAGLAQALSGEGPFTVFAPTDEAFAKLPDGTIQTLLKPENRDKLVSILKYHVVPGRVYSDDALEAKTAKTLQGQPVHVSVENGKARINEANLVATDIDASNGVIHVIDSVLIPQNKKVSAAEARRMIHNAVARGAQLYNRGHHAQCAEVYMTTMREMVERGDKLPAPVMTTLSSTLSAAEQTHCPTQQSWTLRHGLDRAYYAMRTAN